MGTGKRGSVIVPEEEKQTDEAGFWPTSSPPRRAATAGAARMPHYCSAAKGRESFVLGARKDSSTKTSFSSLTLVLKIQ